MPFSGYYDPTDNGRQMTSRLWRGISPKVGSADGFFHFDDCTGLSTQDYTITQGGSAGTIAMDGAEGKGVWKMDAADTDDGDGPTVEFLGFGVTPAAQTIVAFEARIKPSTITDDFFVGIGTTGADPINALPTDYAGFLVNDSGADWTYGQQNGDADTEADVYTAVAATYAKIGFRLVGTAITEIYVNGAEVANTLTAASNPNLVMNPYFVCESSGTTQPTLHCDWWAIGELS